MGIKNFIVKDSYSRIERVDVTKATKTVDYYLTVYRTSERTEVIAEGIRFTVINNAMDKKCSCTNEGTSSITCGICYGTGYIAKNDYDLIFEEALKNDINVLSICYQNLMQRPEFIGTEMV
jgi:hypothetical protein